MLLIFKNFSQSNCYFFIIIIFWWLCQSISQMILLQWTNTMHWTESFWLVPPSWLTNQEAETSCQPGQSLHSAAVWFSLVYDFQFRGLSDGSLHNNWPAFIPALHIQLNCSNLSINQKVKSNFVYSKTVGAKLSSPVFLLGWASPPIQTSYHSWSSPSLSILCVRAVQLIQLFSNWKRTKIRKFAKTYVSRWDFNA